MLPCPLWYLCLKEQVEHYPLQLLIELCRQSSQHLISGPFLWYQANQTMPQVLAYLFYDQET